MVNGSKKFLILLRKLSAADRTFVQEMRSAREQKRKQKRQERDFVEVNASISPASFTNSLGMQFRLIPAGTFTMGSPASEDDRGNDETQHKVTLTQPFYIGVYEVTQGDFRRFVEATNYETTAEKEGTAWGFDEESEKWQDISGLSWRNPGFDQTSTHPVVCVSWNDCRAYIGWLNRQYGSELRRELGEGWLYGLPSESQWEYACRAGTTTPYSFGGTLNGDHANCYGKCPYGTETEGRYLGRTTDVGSYPPNSWGVYDMHGNVCEWCSDWYDDAYPRGRVTNPMGPPCGLARVLRGGSWDDEARYCRSADRAGLGPTGRSYGLGCRVALVRASK